jgi:hypothetical protein
MANIIKFLLSLGNTKARLFREINHLRTNTQHMQKELVPIDEGELKFLSHHRMPQKRFSKQKATVLTSIYNEPFVAFDIKYVIDKESAVMVAYTYDKEFSYIFNKGVIEVFIDEDPFAKILANGHVKDLSNRTVGALESTYGTSLKRLVIHDKLVADLKKPEQASITARAYTALYTNTKNDEDLVLAVTLPELVFQWIKKQ